MDDEPELAPEEFVAEENLNYDKSMRELIPTMTQSRHQTILYLSVKSPPLKPFNAGPSPSTLHLRQKREKTSTSPLPTIKPSSCVGTTPSAILPSLS